MDDAVAVRPLALERFRAAMGFIEKEADLRQTGLVALAAAAPYLPELNTAPLGETT